MIRLLDVMTIDPTQVGAIRTEERERPFKLGMLMDKVNRRSSNTTLLTTFDAVHSGTVVNWRVYPGLRVRDSVRFWTEPYRKPVLERHKKRGHQPGDPEPKVYGRVRNGEFVQLVDEPKLAVDWKRPGRRDEGSGLVKVQAGISAPDAIEEILDGRFLTVSQGSDTDHLFCSACGNDWGLQHGRCDHLPGRPYRLEDSREEGIMYFITGLLFFDHLAKCNTPAQPYSTVLEHQFMDAKELDDLFSGGEVHNGLVSKLVLIDSRDGAMELLLDSGSPHQDPTSGWTREDWAEAMILTSLADAGRLRDSAFDNALPRVEAFRTSERKPSFGQPKSQIGPGGFLKIYDAQTAKAALKVLDSIRVSDPDSLKSRILECVNSLVPVQLGDSTMPNDPAKEWAEIVQMADGLDEAKECDWSDYDGDLRDLAYEEAEAEAEGCACGIITADAKLTTKSRKALPDSAFCGPGRSFPAHDAAHVRNALSRLPQAKNFSPAQKASILACVRRKAKSLGVKVSADQLEYSELVKLMDQKDSSTVDLDQAPPEGETVDQKATRLEAQLEKAKAKIEDQDSKISTLLDEAKDLRGELHRMLARKVYDLKSRLEKPEIAALDSQEKQQEFLGKLELRTTASLRDSIEDLTLELSSSKKDLRDADKSKDPTMGEEDNSKDKDDEEDEDENGKSKSKKKSKSEEIDDSTQADKLSAALGLKG